MCCMRYGIGCRCGPLSVAAIVFTFTALIAMFGAFILGLFAEDDPRDINWPIVSGYILGLVTNAISPGLGLVAPAFRDALAALVTQLGTLFLGIWTTQWTRQHP